MSLVLGGFDTLDAFFHCITAGIFMGTQLVFVEQWMGGWIGILPNTGENARLGSLRILQRCLAVNMWLHTRRALKRGDRRDR